MSTYTSLYLELTTRFSHLVTLVRNSSSAMSAASRLTYDYDGYVPFKGNLCCFLTSIISVAVLLFSLYSVYTILKLLIFIYNKIFGNGCESIQIASGKGPGGNERVFACGQWAEPGCERPAKRRYTEGLRWLKQADVDHRAALNDLDKSSPAYEWVCFKCYQASEKGVNAVLLLKNKNDSKLNSVDHEDIVHRSIRSEDDFLCECVRELDKACGPVARMNFLDRLPFPKIPSDMFSEKDALTAARICAQMLSYIRLQYFDRPA